MFDLMMLNDDNFYVGY